MNMSEPSREMTYDEQVVNFIIHILAIETPFSVKRDLMTYLLAMTNRHEREIKDALYTQNISAESVSTKTNGRQMQTAENEETSVDDPIVYRGDEIEALDTGSKVRFIAWYIYDDEIHGIDEDGGDYTYPLNVCRKTGRHYDIIFKPLLSDSEKEKIKQSLNVDPLCC